MSEKPDYKLIASTDGESYSIFVRELGQWKHTKPKKDKPYTPFKGYVPLHMKNFRRGCKLLIQKHWPSYKGPDISQART